MNVFGVFSTQGSQGLAAAKGLEAIKATEQATEITARQGVGSVHDAVTLSTDAVRAAEGVSDIRMDKVAAIKAAIADGSYETPEKLDIALDRLLERLS
jgi:negative regulator of flagellin synthesis FlgM